MPPFYKEYYRQVIDLVRTYHSGPLTWLDAGCGTGKMGDAAYKSLELMAYAEENLSRNVGPTYTCLTDGESRVVEDNSCLNEMIEKYGQAKVIGFSK